MIITGLKMLINMRPTLSSGTPRPPAPPPPPSLSLSFTLLTPALWLLVQNDTFVIFVPVFCPNSSFSVGVNFFFFCYGFRLNLQLKRKRNIYSDRSVILNLCTAARSWAVRDHLLYCGKWSNYISFKTNINLIQEQLFSLLFFNSCYYICTLFN